MIMAQYIDKDALVAEIERRKHKLLDNIMFEHDKEWVVRTAHQLNRIIMFIDTLEVKEVDLEPQVKELAKVQHIKEMCKENGDSLTQEPVSEELEEAADRGMVEEIIINLKRVENDYRIDLTREIEWLRNLVKIGE